MFGFRRDAFRFWVSGEEPVTQNDTLDAASVGMGVYGGLYKASAWDVDKARKNPTVLKCVNFLADQISTLEWSVVNPKEGSFSPVEHKINEVLRNPNVAMTGLELKRRIVHDLMYYGNCYLRVLRKGGAAFEIYPLDPSTVTPYLNPARTIRTYRLDDGKVLKESEVIHILDKNSEGVEGLSRILQAKDLIEQDSALDAQMTNFFRNGLSVGAVIVPGGPTTPDEREKLGKAWQEKFGSGSQERGSVAVLPQNSTFEVMDPPKAADADTQALKTQSMNRIAGIFDIPSAYLNIHDGSKYNNLSQTNSSFYRTSLHPIVENIAQKLSDGLLGKGSEFAIAFDNARFVKGDIQTQSKTSMEMYNAGLVTLNEARDLAGLPKVEGGNKFVEAPKAPEPSSNNDYEADSTGQYGPRESGGYSNE